MTKKPSKGILGYFVLIGTLLLIAILLNGGLNRTVSKRIEYPDLLNAISKDEVGRVAIRGTSLVGVYNGKNRQTMTADVDFPERSYDFETTIGDDFIETVRQMKANKDGKELSKINHPEESAFSDFDDLTDPAVEGF